MKQMLTTGKIKLANMMGDRTNLSAMRTNEEDTVSRPMSAPAASRTSRRMPAPCSSGHMPTNCGTASGWTLLPTPHKAAIRQCVREFMQENEMESGDSKSGKHEQARALTEQALDKLVEGDEQAADALVDKAKRLDPSGAREVVDDSTRMRPPGGDAVHPASGGGAGLASHPDAVSPMTHRRATARQTGRSARTCTARGALSGRQRSSLVPWRKRPPVTWSKRTSTTSSGRSGSHSPLRSVLQRLGPPGALPVKPGGRRSFSSRRGQRRPLLVGDRRGEADVVELALRRRRGRAAASRPPPRWLVAEAADHAIGGAQPLDLDHARARRADRARRAAWRPRRPSRLAGFVEPASAASRSRVHGDRSSRSAHRGLAAKRLQGLPRWSSSGWSSRRSPSGAGQHVEQRRARRRLRRQLADPALGRMQPHLQGIEGEPPADLDHQLAVDDEPLGRQAAQQRDDFRKIPAERLARLGAQVDLVAGLEGQAAEAVPLGLVTASRRRRAAPRPSRASIGAVSSGRSKTSFAAMPDTTKHLATHNAHAARVLASGCAGATRQHSCVAIGWNKGVA